MSLIEKICHFVDIINEWLGSRIVNFLLIPIVFIIASEVVLRYIFDRPTLWSWDVSLMLFATVILMGGGYIFLHDGHVKVDILLRRLPTKTTTILNLGVDIFLVFTCGLLLWKLGDFAWESMLARETWGDLWNPPIYPMKLILALGAFLLLLQVLVKLFRDLIFIIQPRKYY